MNNKIIEPLSKNILIAADLLKSGQLVAIPTETVYGLAANALDDQAVARIYELKNRPQFNPLIIHFAELEQVSQHVVLNETAVKLADAFWPGPLTMVLPRKESSPISLLASAGLDTLAVRVPNHSVSLELLKQAQVPLAAPSANPSQALSPTTAEHVLNAFHDNDKLTMILDGGPCEVGLESTIIDLTEPEPVILRPGAITAEAVSQVIGKPVSLVSVFHVSDKPKAPGLLHRHYAPNLPLRLNAKESRANEALLAFGPNAPTHSLNLSSSGNLTEAAANLFKMLRQLDQPRYQSIAVMPIPNIGLGLAINNRLERASVR
jgi:L-threonylcarbamoyladenylate synthase